MVHGCYACYLLYWFNSVQYQLNENLNLEQFNKSQNVTHFYVVFQNISRNNISQFGY